MAKEEKLDCAVALLNATLKQERVSLKVYETNASSNSPIESRWGLGNIGSCKTRIKHYEIALSLIKDHKVESNG